MVKEIVVHRSLNFGYSSYCCSLEMRTRMPPADSGASLLLLCFGELVHVSVGFIVVNSALLKSKWSKFFVSIVRPK